MIDRETQIKLFDEYGTPEHVRRHCDAVADASIRIGQALRAAGADLDLELMEGAARVHDIARTARDHENVGADFLIEKGYPREAELVRHHMSHWFGNLNEIDEQDIICLADRVVREDEYVGIEKRVEYLLAKPFMTPEKAEKMKEAMAETQRYINGIEEMIGMTLDEILR